MSKNNLVAKSQLVAKKLSMVKPISWRCITQKRSKFSFSGKSTRLLVYQLAGKIFLVAMFQFPNMQLSGEFNIHIRLIFNLFFTIQVLF